MTVETLDARRLSKANAREIAELLVRVWPKPDKNVEFRLRQMLALGDGYDGPENQAPRCFVVRSSGRVIAHATFLPRTISTTAGLLTIAGLARVCSDPEYRGQKLGEKVVRAVFELIDQGAFPFSLFQTTPAIRPFYEKLGACGIENPIVNSLAKGLNTAAFWDKVIMRYPNGGKWPEGQIDLCGPGY